MSFICPKDRHRIDTLTRYSKNHTACVCSKSPKELFLVHFKA